MESSGWSRPHGSLARRSGSGAGDAPLEVVLHLVLDPEGRPKGTVSTEVGTGAAPTEFSGWLALMAELSRLVAGQKASGGPEDD